MFIVKNPKELSEIEIKQIKQIISDSCDIIISRFYGKNISDWIKSFYNNKNYFNSFIHIFLHKENNTIIACAGLSSNNELKMLYYSKHFSDQTHYIQIFIENIKKYLKEQNIKQIWGEALRTIRPFLLKNGWENKGEIEVEDKQAGIKFQTTKMILKI